MKKKLLIKYCLLLLTLFFYINSFAQAPQNWTDKQLTAPKDVAANITAKKNVPIIFSVGPGAIIPNSINIGMTKEVGNLEKFKTEISKLPKTSNILIYCGCCPFEHCPNVRPAIALLQKMNFTNYHLLNLPHNIKTDWISKGYPTIE